MIGKLFTHRFLPLFALLLAAGISSVKAQTAVLTTTSPSVNKTFVTSGALVSDYVTFVVENNQTCPVYLTNLSYAHIGLTLFNSGAISLSANGATYELWYHMTNTSGSPAPITTAAGWALAGVSQPINTGTSNAITPIMTNLKVAIPVGTRVRFVLRANDTLAVGANTLPLSVTNNNVTLYCGSSNDTWSGIFPSGATFNASSFPGYTSWNFEGSITLENLAPPTPVADITLKPVYRCIGGSMTLKATSVLTGGTFTWKNAAGTTLVTNTTGTHTINNLKLSDAGRYYVTYFHCGKESAADSVTLIINNPPAPTISGKLDYCLNEQFEYTVVNGTNPKWYYTDTGGSPVPVIPTINTSTPNTLIYYVSQTDANGCESAERTLVRYRAAPKPARPIVNTPVYYCEDAIADQLSAIGDTLRWYYFPVGGISTAVAPTPNTSVNDSFQYYVTQTIDGCESERKRLDVVVTFKPNGIILLDKNEICAKDTITINYYGSAYAGSQYNWTLPTNGTTILNGGFDQGPLVIRLDSAGDYEVKLRVGNTGCLSDLYTEKIKVNPLPYGRISFKQDVCLGQPELMEALGYTPGLDTFMWNFAGGKTTHYTTDQGPYGVYWETAGEKIINLTFVDQGCTGSASDTITVHPKPNATIVGTYEMYTNDQKQFLTYDYKTGDQICASDSLKVSVQTVEPGATYKWTPARFFDKYSDVPVTYARVDFKSKIYVEVEDVYGCQNKDSLEILTKSCCEMTFPSAFTPNGDGRNDLFRPVTIGRREIETFRVVNRYGQTVYEARQSGQGWDGTMNGKPADVGTYFYVISFMCEKEKVDQGGEVILVR